MFNVLNNRFCIMNFIFFEIRTLCLPKMAFWIVALIELTTMTLPTTFAGVKFLNKRCYLYVASTCKLAVPPNLQGSCKENVIKYELCKYSICSI